MAQPAGSSARRWAAQQGSTTLETAVVFPMVLVLVVTIIQAVLYWHATEVALSAAQQGLAAASTAGLTTGEARAAQVAAQLGGLGSASVSGSSGTEVLVRVSGRAPSILPGFSTAVVRSASGPAEAFGRP